jgi:hypothetical protein
MRISLLTILLLFAFYRGFSAEISEERIRKSFDHIFPGKKMKIEKLDESTLLRIINTHLKNSYRISGLEAVKKRDQYSLEAIEESYMPNLTFGVNYQNYATWHREVTVNARVPIKWDNDNPVITNINLPNGGEGIIWLPRPIGFAYKDIQLNASDPYRDELFKGDISLNKKFDFGLRLNALSYSTDFRLNPNVYGFPWTTRLTTSFMMPLLKNFGKEGQQEHVEIEKMKLGQKIEDENLRAAGNSIVANVMRSFADTYYYYNKAIILDSVAQLLNKQVEDVDLLVDNSRVTVSESISIKSRRRNIDYEIQHAINNYIYSSANLNFDLANSEEITIYIPDIDKIDELIGEAKRIFHDNNSEKAAEKLIENHPRLVISNYDLQKSRIDRKYYYNQQKPEIDIVGTFGAFEVNRLGYGNPWEAAGNNFVDPDGVQWNFGVQYRFPTGSYKEDMYQASILEIENKEISLQQTRKQIGETLAQYLFRIRSSIENIDNSRSSLEDIRKMIDSHADPLYEKNRISRYYYCSYLSELQSGRLQLMTAYKEFFTYFLMFSADMNVEIGKMLEELR